MNDELPVPFSRKEQSRKISKKDPAEFVVLGISASEVRDFHTAAKKAQSESKMETFVRSALDNPEAARVLAAEILIAKNYADRNVAGAVLKYSKLDENQHLEPALRSQLEAIAHGEASPSTYSFIGYYEDRLNPDFPGEGVMSFNLHITAGGKDHRLHMTSDTLQLPKEYQSPFIAYRIARRIGIDAGYARTGNSGTSLDDLKYDISENKSRLLGHLVDKRNMLDITGLSERVRNKLEPPSVQPRALPEPN
jgi:hypothetical protein